MNRKKLTKIILIAIAVIAVVIFTINENAASVFNDILSVLKTNQGAQSNSPVNTNTNTNTSRTQNNESLDSLFGPVGPNYSTTNKEGRAEEIRELEMQELRNQLDRR